MDIILEMLETMQIEEDALRTNLACFVTTIRGHDIVRINVLNSMNILRIQDIPAMVTIIQGKKLHQMCLGHQMMDLMLQKSNEIIMKREDL